MRYSSGHFKVPKKCKGCRYYQRGECELVMNWYRELDPVGVYLCKEDKDVEK